MQATAPHWIVMVEEVTSDTLTEVGAADGAGNKMHRGHQIFIIAHIFNYLILPSLQSQGH